MTDPRDITDDADFPAPKCGVCGIPWVSHMGIMGVCLWNKALKEDLKESQEEIALLRKERDEARRMYCSMVENNARQYGTSAQSVATQAGWDCFKKEETQ